MRVQRRYGNPSQHRRTATPPSPPPLAEWQYSVVARFNVSLASADSWRFSMDAAFEQALLSFLSPANERQVKIINTIPVANTPSSERTLVVRFDVPTPFDGFMVYNAITDPTVDFAKQFATKGLIFTTPV